MPVLCLFLVLWNVSRRFVPKIAWMAAPLNSGLHNDEPSRIRALAAEKLPAMWKF